MKILSYRLFIFSLWIVSCSAFADASPTSVSSVWPTYQGNASHTGFVPLTFEPRDFRLLWQRKLLDTSSAPILSMNTPITTNESLYISTNCYSCQFNELFDLSADTGATKWSKSLGIDSNVNAPTYSNNRVYIQSTSDTIGSDLRAYDAETGQIIYRAPFESQADHRFPAPTVYNNQIYILGDLLISGYDVNTGLLNWSADYSLDQDNIWSIAAYDDYLVTYLVDDDQSGALVVRDRYHGDPVAVIHDPNYTANAQYDLAPVLDETKQLAFIAFTGYLTAYDIQGQKISYSIGNNNFSGQPDLANGTVYAKYGSNSVEAVDEQTGRLQWSWSAGTDRLLRHPFIVTNNLLFISGLNTTYAVSLSTHKIVWSYPASGQLAISQDKLFIVNDDSTIYAISLV